MQNQQYQVFTHNDLDGAVSLLTLLWSKPEATINFKEVSNSETSLIKDYVRRTINPTKTFLLDLSIKSDFLPELDQSHITIIDHHQSSEKFINLFKRSKILYKNISSTCLLTRKIFAENAPIFTNEQKKLILLADDYDSYKLNFEESYDLNILFWSEYRKNFVDFINTYKNGFKPFSDIEKSKIKSIKINAANKAETIQKFGGFLEFKGIKKYTLGAITESSNNLIMDYIIKKHDPDLFFFINTKTQKVSIRQKITDNPINLEKLAEKFCDGAGHLYAAGGKITPLFMELTKNLNPI